MSDQGWRPFDRDYSVGAKGISGHFDTMLSHFRGNDLNVTRTVAVWFWVASWPSPFVILNIGPIITAGFLIKLALFAWSASIWWQIGKGAWFGTKWLELEHQKLHFILRNDHCFRIRVYRVSDNYLDFDGTKQSVRIGEELAAAERRRKDKTDQSLDLAKRVGWLFVIEIALLLFPWLAGKDAMSFLNTVGSSLSPNNIAAQVGDQAPALASWLVRPDVDGLIAPVYNPGFLLTIYVLFSSVLPAAWRLVWTQFDIYVHDRGYQFIPAAKVLESIIPEKTLDTVREERVHGDAKFVAAKEAAERMARN